jgi:anthranilate synthase component 1
MRGRTVSVQAGAGIVADSNPEKEYQESLNKASALAVAIEMAEGLDQSSQAVKSSETSNVGEEKK